MTNLIACPACGYACEPDACRNPACLANPTLSDSHRATLVARHADWIAARDRQEAATAERRRLSAWEDAQRAARLELAATLAACARLWDRWARDVKAGGYRLPPGPDRDAWRALQEAGKRDTYANRLAALHAADAALACHAMPDTALRGRIGAAIAALS